MAGLEAEAEQSVLVQEELQSQMKAEFVSGSRRGDARPYVNGSDANGKVFDDFGSGTNVASVSQQKILV